MTASTRLQSAAGPHGHRIHPANMVLAGVTEMIGTFFLIFTGSATAGRLWSRP